MQGCFDAALHQTALYDFLAGGIIFAALLLLERRPRFDGFFLLAFAGMYGLARFVTDFARAADKDLLGPLTGSQLTALATIAAVLLWVAIRRPDRRLPYAWNPPDFTHPWDDHMGDDVVEGDLPASEPVVADGPTHKAESESGDEGYSSTDGAR